MKYIEVKLEEQHLRKNKCRYYGYFSAREQSNRDSLSKRVDRGTC